MRLLKSIYCFMLLPLLCLLMGILVQAEQDSKNIVYSTSELTEWLKTNADAGGEVFLGDTIIINYPIQAFYDVDFIINTGPHSIIYEGGCFATSNFTITGDGVSNPVLEIRSLGDLDINWSNALQIVTVTANGKNGIGGTAVMVSQDDSIPFNTLWDEEEKSINSYGEGAVGVHLAVPATVHCLNVNVSGKHSVAVYAEYESNMYYCRLSAAGTGAISATANEVLTLHASTAEYVTENVRMVEYRITDVINRPLYLPVKLGSNIRYINYNYTFLLTSADEQFSYMESFKISWSTPPGKTDTGTVSKYFIPGSLPARYHGFGLESDFPLELIVDVRNPEIPCISSVTAYNTADMNYALVSFWENCGPDTEGFILWRSDDNGASWYDFTDSPLIEWSPTDFLFYYDEISSTIMLQLEVLEVGESNIALLYPGAKGARGGFGGDRTGTDRVIKGDETEPATETEEESETISEKQPPSQPKPTENNSSAIPGGQNSGTGRDDISSGKTTSSLDVRGILNPLSAAKDLRTDQTTANRKAAASDSDRSSGIPAVPRPANTANGSVAAASQTSESESSSETPVMPPRIIRRPAGSPLAAAGILPAGIIMVISSGLFLWNNRKTSKG